MRAAKTLAVVIVTCLWCNSGRSDFILVGDEHLDVNTEYVRGILYDTSTADILENGHVQRAYINDTGTMSVIGGSVDYLFLYNTGEAFLTDGYIRLVRLFEASTITVSGGAINSTFDINDDGKAQIDGGNVNRLKLFNGTLEISGGNVGEISQRGGNVYISGGDIETYTNLTHGGLVTFHGYDFRMTAGLFPLGSSGEVGGSGLLTGRWYDGTLWVIQISRRYPHTEGGFSGSRVLLHTVLPGDANADNVFNQLDIVQVLRSDKYMLDEFAAWSEGDWNSDSRFNQLDLIEALIEGRYGAKAVAALAVPEPDTFLLFITGLLFMRLRLQREPTRLP